MGLEKAALLIAPIVVVAQQAAAEAEERGDTTGAVSGVVDEFDAGGKL